MNYLKGRMQNRNMIDSMIRFNMSKWLDRLWVKSTCNKIFFRNSANFFNYKR